ncbi:MAG TPA: FAD-dependent thymidylate synthase [Candidatus Dormibacteraeota bacterium]|nr:FAD-dependent thymidylate synthase [Candidatus Dormibacteraeota bacterium]
MNRGKLIILDGPTGSGKSTQAQILLKKFELAKLSAKIFNYPDINNSLISRLINRLTDNPGYKITKVSQVLLEAITSSETMSIINRSLNDGVYCICESSFIATIVKYCYSHNIENYEDVISLMSFSNMGIIADLTIIFDAPPKTLIERSQNDARTDNISIEDIEKIRTGYLFEARKHQLPVIFATDSIDSIADMVWEKVTKCLAIRNSSNITYKASEPVALSEILSNKSDHLVAELNESDSYILNNNGVKSISKNGIDFLNDVVTNTTDDVYAFKDTFSTVTVAAAMARLSRRGDDLRLTLVDEFSGNVGADQKLLKRIISEYGDDSVQQLSGHHLVIEGASNLLTKKIEWGRLAAYLEQSTRYIYYDRKNSKDEYNYFIPKELNASTKKNYKKTLDKIYDNYSNIVVGLVNYLKKTSKVPEKERDVAWRSAIKAQACDVARNVLPVAAKSTVGVYGSAQAIESLIMRLMSDDLYEAKSIGKKILNNMRQIAPVFYERADDPIRGGANIAYRVDTNIAIEKLSKSKIKASFSSDLAPVTLIDYYPRNEIDLIPYMLYEHSDLSLAELKKQVSSWSYKDKNDLFDQYIGNRLNRRHKPGRAIEIARYSWDLVCDYGIFRDLQRHRIVDNLVWQDLTPRYGFEIPKLIEDTNLIDMFEECFELSLKLYSQMKTAGYDKQAQYVTLLGHRMRCQVTYNAREAFHIHELRTSPQGHPGYRKLVLEMHKKLSEVHPLLAKAMKFVNSDDDPELSRLAAERYKQLKLKKLV